VLNHTQFNDIDRTARFDSSGAQINANFGTAIGISSRHVRRASFSFR
jgi:hypothetical protein